ncbi:MAG: L-histidine N(alpha)-methyltransferase [Acidimicrobiales bacterium]|nr:L-histidine N(alpha)-methyltransferase [Acidimicrobiales bacterium]
MPHSSAEPAAVLAPIIDVYLDADDWRPALRTDVRRGFADRPKHLPPKWFYDDRGSQLFDRITRLPEYYLTRREREILATSASQIAAASAADTLVELGSGTSEKTRVLLDALWASGRLKRTIGFDVSEGTLRTAASELAAEYPGVEVRGVVGDFDRHLDRIPRAGARLIAFLGSTIGNFAPVHRARFLAELAGTMDGDDSLLLGTDLVKDPARLEAAYNDAEGISHEFNKNVLHVLNRELQADFDVDAFEHVARYEPEHEWIWSGLRSRREQTVTIAALDMTVTFAADEMLHTEVSAKFRLDGLREELAAVGLHVTGHWTDPAGDYGLTLAQPR